MVNAVANRRLADLLIDPREAPEVEIKGWLDLVRSNDDKATLAKALLALANHGGGFVLIGLTETDTGAIPAPGRPATLDGYSQDQVNGIVQSYADPPFHCAVHHVAGPDGGVHPIIVVPGGHRVPIRAKRGGPGNATIQLNAVYVRRPGPRSETPQSAQDWDDLFARCLSARRDELLDRVRDLLSGAVALPGAPAAPDSARLDRWTEECLARWQHVVAPLPPDDPRRCSHGHYWFAYELRGDLRRVAAPAFLEVLNRSTVRYTGWPPFWVPTRREIAPYMNDGAIECWLGRDADDALRDAAHADFWRVSPDGLAFLLRGYQEDGPELAERRRSEPERLFDVTLPVWRVGEGLLQAERLATNLAEGAVTVAFRAHYTGLNGRELVSVSGQRSVWEGRISHQDSITLDTVVEAQAISPNLVEIVHPLLEPLYALFDFFQLPTSLVHEELGRLRANRF